MRSSYVKRNRIDTSIPTIRKPSRGEIIGGAIGGAVNAYNLLPARLRWKLFHDKDALRQAVKAGILNPDGSYVVDDQMEEWKRRKEMEEDSQLPPIIDLESNEQNIRELAAMEDLDPNAAPDTDEDVRDPAEKIISEQENLRELSEMEDLPEYDNEDLPPIIDIPANQENLKRLREMDRLGWDDTQVKNY